MVNFSENNNCKISSNSLESSSQESNTSSREDLRSLGSRDSETQEGFDLGFDFSCLDVSDEDSKNDETFTVNFGTETIPDDLEEFQTCLEHLNDGYENVRLKELEVFGAVYETIRKINSSATEEEILEHLLDLRSSQESGSLADVSYSEIIYGLQQIWIMEQIAKNNALKKTEVRKEVSK